MTGWAELERFLQIDPRDVGCEEALRVMHIYVELLLDDATGAQAARRFPGVAAHLSACDPCVEDFDGLLLAVQADQSG